MGGEVRVLGQKAKGRGQRLLRIKKPRIATGLSMNMAATYSPRNKSSTIGHEGLNYSVRNGKR